ncbi:uncharacterized protein LOC132902201 [Amyelois transitella]|uniref:uncharacterized protein LOC132902201 n=1 Tax=Amyelois transitella TaxID=680683 RepID=UPI00298FAC94|nr:uncharacterized protein LOC132902201 [Amyelois transitella]
MLTILIMFILFGIKIGHSEYIDVPNEFHQVKSYEDDIKLSIELDKEDKQILTSWKERFQMKQVNLTADYRIQMMKHRDHNFGTNISEKWEDCIHTYKRNINKMEFNYNRGERICLKTSLTSTYEKKQAVTQIEKEKNKWRKGYKHLVYLCKSSYVSEKDVALCLVEYVEKDNYHRTLQRLIYLKLRSMAELLWKYNKAVCDLEECLRINLSEYLTRVKSVMKVLDRCYRGRKNK